MSAAVVVEVGPRDGLQNEPRAIPTAEKIALVDALSEAGLTRIEVASFVSARWVPQMADGAAVMAGIRRRPGVRYAALAPNLKGYGAARAAGADEVAIFASASESFSARNLNAGIDESLARYAEVAEAAAADGLPLRAYVSCVVHCPYEGPVAPEAVVRVAARLLEMGAGEIALGDTTGQGVPETVGPMLAAVTGALPPDRLAGHFHDTNGRALESVGLALEAGIRVFDAAVAGLGGCPFAPGAKGNLATEALVAALAAKGYDTGVDPEALSRAAAIARRMVDTA